MESRASCALIAYHRVSAILTNNSADRENSASFLPYGGKPWVRVVIVNYNSGPLIQNCVNALAAQSFGAFEAVIVDNASLDGSADQIKKPDARFRLIRSPENLGFAAGCNLGANSAKTPWLAMLNPDAIPNPDWLEQLHLATIRYKSASLFGSKQIMAKTPETLDGFGDVYSVYGIPWRGGYGWPAETCPKEDCLVFSPCAAAALYKRELYVRLEGFDEDFFCYLEDVDFGFRARLEGCKCVQLCNAIVHHFGSAITGRTSDFTIFYSYRNRVWLLLKNVPAVLLPLMVPLYVLAMTWLFLRTRKLQPWRMQWRGFWAARKGLGRVWRKRKMVQRRRVLTVGQLARQLVWNNRSVRRRDYGCLGTPKT